MSDTQDGLGGQVSVLKTGPAINSNGTVTVNGGLVFAFGTNAGADVSASVFYAPVNGMSGMVGAWNQAAGALLYVSGTSVDLTPIVGVPPNFRWDHNPAFGSGNDKRNGVTARFFPLNLVTVVQDYGLIFDATPGNIYTNVDDTGNPATNPIFSIGQGTLCTGVSGELTLNGFYWKTGTPVALTIVGGNTKITQNPSRRQAPHSPPIPLLWRGRGGRNPVTQPWHIHRHRRHKVSESSLLITNSPNNRRAVLTLQTSKRLVYSLNETDPLGNFKKNPQTLRYAPSTKCSFTSCKLRFCLSHKP